MTNCDYTACRHNSASSPRLKRYGSKCMTNSCIFNTSDVKWILNCSVGDCNWNPKALTHAELKYCLHKEKRRSGVTRLQAELRRREKAKEAKSNGKDSVSV